MFSLVFGLYHGYLLLTNQTTIEFREESKQTFGRFDRGWWRNFLRKACPP